jgi:DNA repair protein RadC
MITQGGFSGTIVDPRQIFNWAILEQASSIILAHNHPSGNLFPSELDRDITKKIVKAGEILGIQVVDHVIITSGGYYSFADHGAI